MNLKRDPGFTPAGFFVLRTPLLPWDELTRWSEGLEAPNALERSSSDRLERALAEDRALLRARLAEVVTRPEVREALLVASPTLEESLPHWLAAPDSERGLKVEQTLVRYFARMAGRSTPFGLFAGCSFGRIAGAETHLVFASKEHYGRHTRLDMDYLFSLCEALCKHPNLRPHLTVRPNSSLYLVGGRMRYAEARLEEGLRTYHLVAVEPTDYLEATLGRAAVGARPKELARHLVEADPEIELEEAEGFIDELLNQQLLVANLAPQVTGPEPVQAIISELAALSESAEATLVARRLDETRRILQQLDTSGPGSQDPPYRAIAAGLAALPAPVDLSRLFQVDMTKPAPEAALGPAVLDQIAGAIRLLHRITPRVEDDALRRFREAFNNRWEGREIPLVEALDEESGIGFASADGAAAGAEPLIEGLLFPAAGASSGRVSAGFSHLLRRVEMNRGALELTLDEADFAALEQKERAPLPDAFAALATVSAESESALAGGDFRVHLHGAFGPSGANLLGRFCHRLPALDEAIKRYVAAEEALRPDAIFRGGGPSPRRPDRQLAPATGASLSRDPVSR